MHEEFAGPFAFAAGPDRNNFMNKPMRYRRLRSPSRSSPHAILYCQTEFQTQFGRIALYYHPLSNTQSSVCHTGTALESNSITTAHEIVNKMESSEEVIKFYFSPSIFRLERRSAVFSCSCCCCCCYWRSRCHCHSHSHYDEASILFHIEMRVYHSMQRVWSTICFEMRTLSSTNAGLLRSITLKVLRTTNCTMLYIYVHRISIYMYTYVYSIRCYLLKFTIPMDYAL